MSCRRSGCRRSCSTARRSTHSLFKDPPISRSTFRGPDTSSCPGPTTRSSPATGRRTPSRLRSSLQETWAEEATAEPETDRVLATILFTDIVGSTAKAVELGDARWRELLEDHHATVRRLLLRYRGTELDTAGDGFFAAFDGPARGIRCARAITESVRDLGIEVRAGLHTGECERMNAKVGGIAVHIGARVAAEAGPGEVVVSSTVKDLVAGSGIAFRDRGAAELKGVPGEWRLFAVESG